jgi:hypothetical protein
MRRPAVRRFGVAACAVLVACWTGRDAPPAQPLANHANAPAVSPLAGSYWCSITEDDFKYPRFPCAIRSEGGHLVLAKLAGSVRFEGEVQPSRVGFVFHGQKYCPWGDCQEELDGAFRERGGHYVATFGEDRHMTVVLERASGPAFGGASYGGDSYGGAAYGGETYGNFAPTGRRRNRRH